MVELNGTLSNPEVRVEVLELFGLVELILTRGPSSSERPDPPKRAGEIKQTVIHVLQMAEKPMRVMDIHRACEEYLDRPVNRSTVSDCLIKHSKGQRQLFVATSRGLYSKIEFIA